MGTNCKEWSANKAPLIKRPKVNTNANANLSFYFFNRGFESMENTFRNKLPSQQFLF
jgi:hypothetical protein